jgi:wobble nucleotide-excising tRNase
MIESIAIENCASYGDEVEEMDGLSPINFVYGPNGAGKTTVSRVIDDASSYPTCAVHWQHGTELETLVYNRDFVNTNFNQTDDLKGILTLGQKDIETQNKIDQANRDVDTLIHRIEQLTYTLQGSDGAGGKRAELAEIESSFRDECWRVKAKHDDKLQGALTGYRGDKQKFKDRLISECVKTSPQPPSQVELETRAASIFGPTPNAETSLPILNDTAFLACEADTVLKKRVIGKADVDIAAMIQKLGNSDWVKQGITFFEMNDGDCPFCQQSAPEQLAASLTEYFDESYTRDTTAISALQSGYKLEGQRIQQTLQSAISSASRFLDVEKLKSEKSIFDSRFQLNLQHIDNKVKEPSQLVTLEPLVNVLNMAKQLIADANQKIQNHNTMVANLASERTKLTNQVWAFLAKVEIDSAFTKYQGDRAGIEKAISSLNLQLSTAEREKAAKEVEIVSLERSTTSIRPTVNEINRILNGFGFRNFSIAATSANRYRICRLDGSDVKDTLSEGERGFITFLYFYHLLKGSNSDTGMTRNRVVVFDDPVSSLDSDVLYIVSSLIKQIIDDVRAEKGHIKQVFVLTHNVYFHKEITFNQRRTGGDALRDETFWTIRKLNEVSTIRKHESNPISTAYELLWSEVREPNFASQTIQNTLRRILEYYFRILGGINPDDILALFEGDEKLICKSLFSWVNEGSHSVPDDVFVALDESLVEKYLDVFKKIFIRLGHTNHYNMMMGRYAVGETISAIQ